MFLSPHSLHPPILKTPQQQADAAAAVASLVARRRHLFDLTLGPKAVYDIPLATISADKGFDAMIGVALRGGAATSMVVDTGNACLIMPRFEDIQALADPSPYTVLTSGPEPWGCQANLVRGPIDLADVDGSVFTIPNCLFWACTGDNPQGGGRTANFGAGCLRQWFQAEGQELKPAQAFTPAFPYAEFDFAPADAVLSATSSVKVAANSVLRITQAPPAGYAWFDILAGDWMALTPHRLSLGGALTTWPAAGRTAMAMIDTGGTCAYLVDPDQLVSAQAWPPMAASNPGWCAPGWGCETTQRAFTLELGDAQNSFTYTLDTAAMPPAVQGETLVMCQTNDYMRNQYGMNIGGISALALSIVVDYGARRVGLKVKRP